MDARSRGSSEATLMSGRGGVAKYPDHTIRPLQQIRLRYFFLIVHPPLLLLRRGVDGSTSTNPWQIAMASALQGVGGDQVKRYANVIRFDCSPVVIARRSGFDC